MALSCFFVHFLPLWLCTVSSYFTLAKSESILIPLYKGIIGFLPYIRLGLLTQFAFFSLYLFTTLGWAYWPICFLFSLFIHYIGLGLLALLFSYLFIYSLHWVGSVDPFYFLLSSFILLGLTYWALFFFSIFEFLQYPFYSSRRTSYYSSLFLTLLFKEGLLLHHSQKGLVGLPLGFIFQS